MKQVSGVLAVASAAYITKAGRTKQELEDFASGIEQDTEIALHAIHILAQIVVLFSGQVGQSAFQIRNDIADLENACCFDREVEQGRIVLESFVQRFFFLHFSCWRWNIGQVGQGGLGF